MLLWQLADLVDLHVQDVEGQHLEHGDEFIVSFDTFFVKKSLAALLPLTVCAINRFDTSVIRYVCIVG